MNEITIKLDRNDYYMLLAMMGYATGAAHRDGNESLADSFVRLANAVNKDNPDWRPYAVPPESITCPRCGMTSYNPNDVREKYCGNCHEFHEK